MLGTKMQNNGLQNNEIEYEKTQNFNRLVAWLHSYRYNNILNIFDELSALDEAKTIHVIDIGCAHGKLFSVLKDKYKISYIGIELNSEFVKVAEERYKEYSNFKIIQGAAENYISKIKKVDIVVALETLEHIPEHTVIRIIEEIAKSNPRYFVSSVPVEIGPAIWFKNIGSLMAGYMRHNEYSWKETFWAGLGNLDKLPPP